jgi:hypothetical protein
MQTYERNTGKLLGWLRVCLFVCAVFSAVQIEAIDVYFRGRNPSAPSGSSDFRIIMKRGGTTLATVNVGTVGTTATVGITWFMGGTFINGDVMEVYVFREPGTVVGSSSRPLSDFQRLADYNVTTAKGDPQYSFDGANIWYDIDSQGTPPPPPLWCIHLHQTNTTIFRQRYAVYTVAGPVLLDTSDWIAPGATFDYQYCNTVKTALQIERTTDSDPPIIDYSRTIDATDAGWAQDDVGGDETGGSDSGKLTVTAPTGGIPWTVGHTNSTDETLQKGFEAIYGVNLQGLNEILQVNKTANQKMDSEKTSIDAINTTLSGKASEATLTAFKTANHTDLGVLHTDLGSLHSDAVVLHGDNVVGATILSNISGKLDAPSAPNVLTNILVSLEKTRTNALSGQDIVSTNWPAFGTALAGSGLTNLFVAETERFTGAGGIAGSFGTGWVETYSFAEPSRSIWQFTIHMPGGSTKMVDCYPFQWDDLALIAKFANRALSWGIIAFAYWVIMGMAMAYVTDILVIPNSPVGVADIATVGGWAVARRVIIAGLVSAIPIAVGAWVTTYTDTLLLIHETPFFREGVLGSGLWLLERFVPITLAWNMFLAVCAFKLTLFAVKGIAMLTMRLMPIVIIALVVQSAHATVGHECYELEVRNGSEATLHVDLFGTLVGSAPAEGVYVPPHSAVSVFIDPSIEPKSASYWIGSWVWNGLTWGSHSVHARWDLCGLMEDGVKKAVVNFTDDGSLGRSYRGVECTYSGFFAFYQGWFLGVGFLGIGLALAIVRKIYRHEPSEL